MSEIKYEIIKKIGVLSKSASGWEKELNLISWNDRDPKYDIREWSPDGQTMGKGITLTKAELIALRDLLNSMDLSSENLPEITHKKSDMTLDDEFTTALRRTCELQRERGYVPTVFMQMIEDHGGVETAKRLLAVTEPQLGLYRLWELHMLTESMEAIVLQDRFSVLFTETEKAMAHRRLDELGYFNK